MKTKQNFIRIIDGIFLLIISIKVKIFGFCIVSEEISHCSSRRIKMLLERYGSRIGKNVSIKPGIQIDNSTGDADATGDFSNLEIGDNCYIGRGVFFDLPDTIEIEDECAISAGVKFITHQDCGDRIMSNYYPREKGKIVIGAGSWLGVNSTILKGVKLGRCCVVGAGSVVTKSFEDYTLIAGIPARAVRKLEFDRYLLDSEIKVSSYLS